LAQILDIESKGVERKMGGKFVYFPSFFLLFIVDQLLFPMFHLAGMPVKISYILIVIWLVNVLFRKKNIDKFFFTIACFFIVIIACSLVGELFVYLKFPESQFPETLWSITIYLLMIFSYGLATSNISFNYRWLYWIFFSAIIMNFAIIFLSGQLPFLANFYYSKNAAEDLGVADVSEIVNMLRPRGIFGNPNTSMLQVNIIYLFIVVFIKKNLLQRPSLLLTALLIMMPMALAVVLGSRSELLITVTYSLVLTFHQYKFKGLFIFSFIGVIFLSIAFFVSTIISSKSGFAQADMLKFAFERFTKADEKLLDKDDDDNSLKRPLILWNTAKNRIISSPLVGSGFNAVESADAFPFDYSPRYYHNDWLRIIVTSGLIGFFSILIFIRNFVLPYDSLLIAPFVFPALTNTFILSIPTIMFYFFMLAILHKSIKKR
jgi:O-antigen ligase